MSVWKGGLCFFPNSIFMYTYMLLLRWLLSPPGHVLSSRGIFSEGALKEKRKTFFKRTQIWVRKNSNFSNANNHLFHNLRFFFHLYNPNSPTRPINELEASSSNFEYFFDKRCLNEKQTYLWHIDVDISPILHKIGVVLYACLK